MTTTPAPFVTDTTAIRAIMQSGYAVFTVLNAKTQTQAIFRVRASDHPNLFFVDVLTVRENIMDYYLIGTWCPGESFRHSACGTLPADAQTVSLFSLLIARLESPQPLSPDHIQFWHWRRQSRTGPDTDQEPGARSIAPKCEII